jgi:hydrogenase assembly chaperone HypC/HupF
MGRVNFGGVVKRVCLDYVPEVEVGDYTIVHVGFAISKIDEATAQQTLEDFRSLGVLDEELASEEEQFAQAAVEHLFLPAFRNPALENLGDAAVLDLNGSRLALSTDSFVVQPLFFPGGSIGDLAVNGTVNDLAVSGAIPRTLSAGFILEEGFRWSNWRRLFRQWRGQRRRPACRSSPAIRRSSNADMATAAATSTRRAWACCARAYRWARISSGPAMR